MENILTHIVDWSEVWSLLIPLAILFMRPKQPPYMRPVAVYVFVAFALNLLADISWKFKADYNFPLWFQVNTWLYSLHAIARFYLFAWFFFSLQQPQLTLLKKILPVLFTAFIIINFIFFESFIHYWFANGKMMSSISNTLLTTEAGLLLIYCFIYYFNRMQEDSGEMQRGKSFWIVTGLSIYVVFNFIFFLFYAILLVKHRGFTIIMWKFHNLSYLVFCIFIAKGLYAPTDK